MSQDNFTIRDWLRECTWVQGDYTNGHPHVRHLRSLFPKAYPSHDCVSCDQVVVPTIDDLNIYEAYVKRGCT